MTVPAPRAFDPIVARGIHRISTVVATNAETADRLRATGRPPGELLRLGRLERFYRASSQQLPQVVTYQDIDPGTLVFQRGKDTTGEIRKARLWLFDVHAGPVVAVISIDIASDVKTLIPFMEDCYYDQIAIGSTGLVRHTSDVLRREGIGTGDGSTFEFEQQRHQIVFLADQREPVPVDIIQRLIYRADLDWRPEYSSITFPSELNRRHTSTAAVGAFVSVLVAQQDYVENCALLSAVQIVSATCRVRQIRFAAYAALLRVRALAQNRAGLSFANQRTELARINETMAEQELQLTFGVETAREIGTLIPALRVDSYHRQLVECTGLADNITTVSSMLTRLGSVLNAETVSQDATDARRQDLRRLRWGAVAGFLSVVAAPIGIILGFFGGQYTQVHPNDSMFNFGVYYPLYLTVGGLIAFAALAFVALFWWERQVLRNETRGNGR